MLYIERLLQDQTGATAIEYALIVSLISVAALAAMQGIGDQLKSTFNATSSSLAGASGSSGGTGGLIGG